MEAVRFDAVERHLLCDLLEQLGPTAPTLLDGWTTRDLAGHLVLREHDLLAAPGLVLPGPYQRFAERRRAKLAEYHDFPWLVARIRSGPPPGFFRIGWVRSHPNLNEFFVHHEDIRRANGLGPRTLSPELEAALWLNVGRGGRFLSRRLADAGLEVEWPGVSKPFTLRPAEPTARLSGPPGEVLLYLFGRQNEADVTITGTDDAVTAVSANHFGM